MSKAKEYYKEWHESLEYAKKFTPRPWLKAEIEEKIELAKTMNHKTLEDVKELFKNNPLIYEKKMPRPIQKLLTQWAVKYLNELEKLKL